MQTISMEFIICALSFTAICFCKCMNSSSISIFNIRKNWPFAKPLRCTWIALLEVCTCLAWVSRFGFPHTLKPCVRGCSQRNPQHLKSLLCGVFCILHFQNQKGKSKRVRNEFNSVFLLDKPQSLACLAN